MLLLCPNLCPLSPGPASHTMRSPHRPTLVPPLKSHVEHPQHPPGARCRGRTGDTSPLTAATCQCPAHHAPHEPRPLPASDGLGSGWRLSARDLPNGHGRGKTARSPLCLGPGLRRRPHHPAASGRRLPLVGGGGTHGCERPSHRAARGSRPPGCRRTSTTRLGEALGGREGAPPTPASQELTAGRPGQDLHVSPELNQRLSQTRPEAQHHAELTLPATRPRCPP